MSGNEHQCDGMSSIDYEQIDVGQLLAELDNHGRSKKSAVGELQLLARQIVTHIEDSSVLYTNLPDTLFNLLTKVIKPLFTDEPSSQLTSTGRRRLVDSSLPLAATQFSTNLLYDDHKPSWKTSWLPLLLSYTIGKHQDIEDLIECRRVTERHFYLMVPPILKEIDDIDISYKAQGCKHLSELSQTLICAQSDVLSRSGITDIFVEALRNNFSYLPTLTPENESLELYQQLYPSFLSLMKVHCSANTATEQKSQQKYLNLLLRHQLLHSLSHLSAGTGAGGTTAPRLTTFLLQQAGHVVREMGPSAALHLQSLIPIFCSILSDPFSGTAEGLIEATMVSMSQAVKTCARRIKDLWWQDCLQACVSCWLNIADDEQLYEHTGKNVEQKKVIELLQALVKELNVVVGHDFSEAKDSLLMEEPGLQELFTRA